MVGAGWLGVQIAAHAACFDYAVTIYDPDPGSLERSRANLGPAMAPRGREPVAPMERWLAEARALALSPGLPQALDEADLVIESVPERLEIKQRVFASLGELAPARAILASNSSSLPVSRMARASGRPERCLNLHFYPPTIINNMADLMGCADTLPEVFETVARWLGSIGCLPLRVRGEVMGFCYNRIWRAVKRESLYEWAADLVDFRDIDRAWMTATGMPIGPFGMMDAVGLDVVCDIERAYARDSGDPRDTPPRRLVLMVERGELGLKAGRGFYTYPDPEYAGPDFLRP